MKAIAKIVDAVVIAAVVALFVAGCGGERADQSQEQDAKKPAAHSDKATVPADKIAALEKDVARLRTEVQQLRQRIEVDAKMRSRHGMPPHLRQPGAGGPDGFRDGDVRARHFARRNGGGEMRDDPAAKRQDPATMTPEQRHAWHEERRKMREERYQKMLEERKREKISEPGKQTNQSNAKKESK